MPEIRLVNLLCTDSVSEMSLYRQVPRQVSSIRAKDVRRLRLYRKSSEGARLLNHLKIKAEH